MIGGAVLAFLATATLVGMALRGHLPDHYLAPNPRRKSFGERRGRNVVGARPRTPHRSAKNVYDSADAELRNSGARVVLLDRVLAQYGEETSEARGRACTGSSKTD